MNKPEKSRSVSFSKFATAVNVSLSTLQLYVDNHLPADAAQQFLGTIHLVSEKRAVPSAHHSCVILSILYHLFSDYHSIIILSDQLFLDY